MLIGEPAPSPVVRVVHAWRITIILPKTGSSSTSEEASHQVHQQFAADRACSAGSPVKETPTGVAFLKTEEQCLAPNFETFEHSLVENANFAFQDVRDEELLGRNKLRRGLERDLHLATLGADPNEIHAGFPEGLRRILRWRKVEGRLRKLTVHGGDELCANGMQVARPATAKSCDVISVQSKVLGLFRGINLACQLSY